MSSTREQLIELLAKQGGSFVSGQWISETLEISRTAVWKQMKQLEKDGYQFEAVPNKGYRIVEVPHKLSANTIQWGLHTKWLGKEIVHHDRISSTQTTAIEYAQEGCDHGTVIVANRQSNGRGRLSRQWYSDNDQGIWLSVVLRPDISPMKAPQLTLVTATVLAEVIEQISQTTPAIKWPNDLLLNNRKLAGILTEMQAEQDKIHYLVIGIGINVNQSYQEMDLSVREIATSLQIETGKTFHQTTFIQLLLECLERRYQQYLDEGFHLIKASWEQYAYKMNKEVTYQTGKAKQKGFIRGIAEDGALLMETESGRIDSLYSAEIDWFSSDPGATVRKTLTSKQQEN
ncbi:BirA family biotin operon repressor/biotin-[acetyl-CoA-carboxylase] ligase [Natronobacillus azotifigens]|uniref:Bifunctional ligase/repressor BirA n=1 Tax=Natronobacillus azotifigens TaxID=472978 RepID=A0A9J6R9C9_9BACI|nr:biotin--[acetyl-CoA-carboxylase] ligase [Natronobacillus azotifigens]